MANIVVSALLVDEAHLEELRRRIIFSILGILFKFLLCWSFAARSHDGLWLRSGRGCISKSH